MDEKEKKEGAEALQEADGQSSEPRPRTDRSQRNAFENFYEHFRNVPLKYIDIFIGVCAVALVAVIAAGIINR